MGLCLALSLITKLDPKTHLNWKQSLLLLSIKIQIGNGLSIN